MAKKNSGADEPQTEVHKLDESLAAEEIKVVEINIDEPKVDEPKADEPKADEQKADESDLSTEKEGDGSGEKNIDLFEVEAKKIMKSHGKKEVWRSGDGYWFSVKDLAEYHAKMKETPLNHYTDVTSEG